MALTIEITNENKEKVMPLEKLQFFYQRIGSLGLIKDFVQKIGFAPIIDNIIPVNGGTKLSWGNVAEILVANRLTAPQPLYRVEDWALEFGISSVFGVASEFLNDDRLGRCLDYLGEHAQVLKGTIALHVAKAFNISLQYTHWDLTTVTLEGEYEDQAPGHIRIEYAKTSKATAQKAFQVGLNVANDGEGPVPIMYEPFDGNLSGFVATVTNMERMKSLLKIDRLIRISDRGCVSAKIITETKAAGFDVIASLKFSSSLQKKVIDALFKGVVFERLEYQALNQLRRVGGGDGYEAFELEHEVEYQGKRCPVRLIVVRSDGKKKRDEKRRDKHMRWLEVKFEELRGKGGKWHTELRVRRWLKKVLSKYEEGEIYDFKIEFDKAGWLSNFSYWIKAEALRSAQLLDGIYLLVTTLSKEDNDLNKIFTLFKEQHYVESANRVLKSRLRIKPVFLQRPGRIEGLLFILWLSLLVYMLLEREYRLQVIEDKERRFTAARILAQFAGYGCVIMVSGDKRQLIPEALTPMQRGVYKALGLPLPYQNKTDIRLDTIQGEVVKLSVCGG